MLSALHRSLPSLAALAVAGLVLLSPTAAQAGCGDYLLVGGRHAYGAESPHAAGSSREMPTPCQGPGCQRENVPSPNGPVVGVLAGNDQAANLNGFVDQDENPSTRVDRNEARRPACPSPNSIFRPPRS